MITLPKPPMLDGEVTTSIVDQIHYEPTQYWTVGLKPTSIIGKPMPSGVDWNVFDTQEAAEFMRGKLLASGKYYPIGNTVRKWTYDQLNEEAKQHSVAVITVRDIAFQKIDWWTVPA